MSLFKLLFLGRNNASTDVDHLKGETGAEFAAQRAED